MMAVCCCSLAGTAACQHCSQNPFATDVWTNKTVTVNHVEGPSTILKPMTNADRIRAMTDEELANCITDDLCDRVCHSPLSCDGNCEIQVLEWLKQEAT